MLNRIEVVMGERDTVNEKCNPISSHTLHEYVSSILSLLYSNLTWCLGIECKYGSIGMRLEKCIEMARRTLSEKNVSFHLKCDYLSAQYLFVINEA